LCSAYAHLFLDRFFERDVTDKWLMIELENAEYPIGTGATQKPFKMNSCPGCVGWKTLWIRNVHGHADAHPHQEAKYNEIRKNLRDYIRDHLYIRGQLEPPHKTPVRSISHIYPSDVDQLCLSAATCRCL